MLRFAAASSSGFALLSAAFLLLSAQPSPPRQSPPPPVAFRADVQLVSVTLSVRDPAAGGRLVTGLTQNDFTITEDGVPQVISFFSPSANLPLALGLLVDASGSQEEFFKDHRRHLRAFLRTVLTPRDQAFVLAFGNRLRLLSDFTPSAEVLLTSLDEKQRSRSEAPQLGPREIRILGTAFYDAVVHSIAEKLTGLQQQRKGLILFSDGEDNSSAHHLLDAIEAAQSAAVPIFSIRYTEPAKDRRLTARNKYGISVMARLARETGGADFDAAQSDLASAFAAIGEQLHGSYELAYNSTNPAPPGGNGGFRKIVIRVPARPGLLVRHKSGYAVH